MNILAVLNSPLRNSGGSKSESYLCLLNLEPCDLLKSSLRNISDVGREKTLLCVISPRPFLSFTQPFPVCVLLVQSSSRNTRNGGSL